MALKVSSLSFGCVAIRDFLRTNIEGAPTTISVEIGAPSEVDTSNGANVINLFFYRFDPSGFGPLSRPNEPFRIRAYCLITAFGASLDNISAGENELRMLGEVMRLFHENPILGETEFLLTGETEGERYRLQAVYFQMPEEQLSQFWNANSETGIRPSVAYEFSLLPIVPEQRRIEPPLVAALGAESRADMRLRRTAPTVIPTGPPVGVAQVDVSDPSWQPRVCWISGNTCQLTLAITSVAAATFAPQVWVAGDPAVDVELVWETWRPDTGWTEADAAPVVVRPFSTGIDPDNLPAAVPGTFPAQPPLPAIFAGVSASQVVLYARRSVSLPPGAPPQVVRSNPLLISIFSA
jgi:hypothetical protein